MIRINRFNRSILGLLVWLFQLGINLFTLGIDARLRVMCHYAPKTS